VNSPTAAASRVERSIARDLRSAFVSRCFAEIQVDARAYVGKQFAIPAASLECDSPTVAKDPKVLTYLRFDVMIIWKAASERFGDCVHLRQRGRFVKRPMRHEPAISKGTRASVTRRVSNPKAIPPRAPPNNSDRARLGL